MIHNHNSHSHDWSIMHHSATVLHMIHKHDHDHTIMTIIIYYFLPSWKDIIVQCAIMLVHIICRQILQLQMYIVQSCIIISPVEFSTASLISRVACVTWIKFNVHMDSLIILELILNDMHVCNSLAVSHSCQIRIVVIHNSL